MIPVGDSESETDTRVAQFAGSEASVPRLLSARRIVYAVTIT